MAERRASKILLIIDDDRVLCDVLTAHLAGRDLTVLTAHTAAEGLRLCGSLKVDVVLLDQKLPDARGAELCPSILSRNDRTKIIFITAYPSFDNALKAIRHGAYNYLSKPFEIGELDIALDRAVRTLELERVEQVHRYKSRIEKQETVLIGSSPEIQEIRRLVNLAANNDASVLIRGETGVGKGVVAKLLHCQGAKSDAAFIGVNCASLPENLIEAELFGFEKGAFTGAVSSKKGIFEMAEGGILFLDEIGDLPLHLQSKLLGVLDDTIIKRIGGQNLLPVDVRIVAATNADLTEAVRDGRFREDLYYRLGVMEITVPPLRERLDDIPALCDHFIHKIAPDAEIRLPRGEVARLKRYHWPGNVRELGNILERAVILREEDVVHPSALLASAPPRRDAAPPFEEDGTLLKLNELERRFIRFAVNKCQNNHTRAASALGISRSTLIRKLKTYGLV